MAKPGEMRGECLARAMCSVADCVMFHVGAWIATPFMCRFPCLFILRAVQVSCVGCPVITVITNDNNSQILGPTNLQVLIAFQALEQDVTRDLAAQIRKLAIMRLKCNLDMRHGAGCTLSECWQGVEVSASNYINVELHALQLGKMLASIGSQATANSCTSSFASKPCSNHANLRITSTKTGVSYLCISTRNLI